MSSSSSVSKGSKSLHSSKTGRKTTLNPSAKPFKPKHKEGKNILTRIKQFRTDTKLEGKSLRTLDDRKSAQLSDSESGMVSSLLVNPLQVYRVRLGGYTTMSVSTGVVNAFIAADPSAFGWNSPEWSTLSSLFSEFRLVQLGINIIRNFNSTNLAQGALAIGSNLGAATSPGSYAALADNADVTWYTYTSTDKTGLTHVMNATDLAWSDMTIPTVEPYAGAPGSIQFYSQNDTATGNLTAAYQILIWGIYDFRIRV